MSWFSWFLEHVQVPAAERKPFKHRIKSLRHLGYTAYDDEMKINTQSSSQWDGLSMNNILLVSMMQAEGYSLLYRTLGPSADRASLQQCDPRVYS